MVSRAEKAAAKGELDQNYHFSNLPPPPTKSTSLYFIFTIKFLKMQVYVSEHLVECGLALFKHLRIVQWQALIDGQLGVELLSCHATLRHDLAACYWAALKHCSVRTAVPNRALMSKATGTDAVLLGQHELEALISMEWEVNAVLRIVGLVQ